MGQIDIAGARRQGWQVAIVARKGPKRFHQLRLIRKESDLLVESPSRDWRSQHPSGPFFPGKMHPKRYSIGRDHLFRQSISRCRHKRKPATSFRCAGHLVLVTSFGSFAPAHSVAAATSTVHLAVSQPLGSLPIRGLWPRRASSRTKTKGPAYLFDMPGI